LLRAAYAMGAARLTAMPADLSKACRHNDGTSLTIGVSLHCNHDGLDLWTQVEAHDVKPKLINTPCCHDTINQHLRDAVPALTCCDAEARQQANQSNAAFKSTLQLHALHLLPSQVSCSSSLWAGIRTTTLCMVVHSTLEYIPVRMTSLSKSSLQQNEPATGHPVVVNSKLSHVVGSTDDGGCTSAEYRRSAGMVGMAKKQQGRSAPGKEA
jgi:hypothetical protein